MSDNRKVLIIARHGDAPTNPATGGSEDFLKDVPGIYRTMGIPLRTVVEDSAPEDSVLWHSDKRRTTGTGKAALIGAFYLTDKAKVHRIPRDMEDLENFDYKRMTIEQHPLLSFSDIPFSAKLYKNVGGEGYMAAWLANPAKTEFEGELSISFNAMVSRGRNVVRDMTHLLLVQDARQKDLGFLATHDGNTNTLAVALVNSARDGDPVRSYDEIGGLFGKGDYAVVVAEKTSAGIWKAEYRKGDVKAPVDIERFY